MHADRQSDEPIVPTTSANKDTASAEPSEERGSTKRKVVPDYLGQTLSWYTEVNLFGALRAAVRTRRPTSTDLPAPSKTTRKYVRLEVGAV